MGEGYDPTVRKGDQVLGGAAGRPPGIPLRTTDDDGATDRLGRRYGETPMSPAIIGRSPEERRTMIEYNIGWLADEIARDAHYDEIAHTQYYNEQLAVQAIRWLLYWQGVRDLHPYDR